MKLVAMQQQTKDLIMVQGFIDKSSKCHYYFIKNKWMKNSANENVSIIVMDETMMQFEYYIMD